MIRFRDTTAEKWLRSKSESFTCGLTARKRKKSIETIADGLQRGHNPRQVGLELAGRLNPQTGKREGSVVNLDEYEIDTVSQFKACLKNLDEDYFKFELRDKRYDRSMRRALKEQVPFPSEKISLLVNRFESKLIKQKADLIAQTEMLATLNRSEWISIKAAVEKSNRPQTLLTRIWESCGDEKVRPSHKALDGQQVVGLDGFFVSPVTGAKMMHPGDETLGAPETELKGCRCRIRYEFDFFEGVE